MIGGSTNRRKKLKSVKQAEEHNYQIYPAAHHLAIDAGFRFFDNFQRSRNLLFQCGLAAGL